MGLTFSDAAASAAQHFKDAIDLTATVTPVVGEAVTADLMDLTDEMEDWDTAEGAKKVFTRQAEFDVSLASVVTRWATVVVESRTYSVTETRRDEAAVIATLQRDVEVRLGNPNAVKGGA